MTYFEKTSYFEVAPPGHTIPFKNDENLLKNLSLYSNLLCNLKILLGHLTSTPFALKKVNFKH